MIYLLYKFCQYVLPGLCVTLRHENEILACFKCKCVGQIEVEKSCPIKDIEAKQIAEGLKLNSNIQQLKIFGNEIGDNGAKVISEVLNLNSNLQILYIY